MSTPPGASSIHYPPPVFLSLRKNFPMSPAPSPRRRRAAAVEEELDVFAAEQYFNGAMEPLMPRKTSPETKLPMFSPPQQIYNAILEPAVAPLMSRKPPFFPVFSCFRSSASPSTKEKDKSFAEKSCISEAWKENTTTSIEQKINTADSHADFFRESNSIMFKANTSSIRTNDFHLEKSFKYVPAGQIFGDETVAPIEWALKPVGFWGREPLNGASAVRRSSTKLLPTTWSSTVRTTSNLSAMQKTKGKPISARSSRLTDKASAMRS